MKPTTRSAGAPESQASQDHADDRRSAAGFTRAPPVDEFVLGATVGPAISLAKLVTASSTSGFVLGAWLLGATLNYVRSQAMR